MSTSPTQELLRTQAISRLQGLFGGDAQIVTTSDPQKNARILVASYQTLNIADDDDEPRFWKDNYPPGYFSHIVIDEAHRSAWGKWSVILKDNPHAVHIGLTATPRELKATKHSAAATADAEITERLLGSAYRNPVRAPEHGSASRGERPDPHRESELRSRQALRLSAGGVPISPNTRKGQAERLAYYEARKLNHLPHSLLDYHDVIHGRETPAERRAREGRATGRSR